MKYIELTQGYRAMVDDEDFERVSRFSWRASEARTKGLWYARSTIHGRDIGRPEKYLTILMHRYIMCAQNPGVFIDHKDRNGLNCQKHNLREATAVQNLRNRSKIIGCTSDYKGVSWNARSAVWYAQICVDGKMRHLGSFKSETNAAYAYNDAATAVFTDFALLNSINEPRTLEEPHVKTSQYLGVHKSPFATYKATIRFCGRQIHLGSFKSEVEAANAYNTAAVKYHGEKAKINIL